MKFLSFFVIFAIITILESKNNHHRIVERILREKFGKE